MQEIKSESIEMVDINQIIPNPKNANRHSIEQIKRLEKLIEYQGFRNPLIVSKRTGFLIVGHGRLEAAKNLGFEKLPVIKQEFKDEAQEYAYLISDNEIARWAELDKHLVYEELKQLDLDDIELLGLEDFEMPDIEELDPQTDEDEVPEVVNPITVRGDIWLLGKHRLMCGDSTMIDDVEKLMAGEKADMVFTDPPYGISVVSRDGSVGGGTKGKYKEIIGDNTVDVARDSYNLCVGLEIEQMFFWGANHYSSVFPDSSCWVVWDKQGGKSVTFADCELCYTNLKKPVRMFTHIWDGFRRDSERGEMRVHPTQKPVQLFIDIWDKFDSPKKVLDLFLGSGSTLMACEKSDRSCQGMEMDEHYCDVIINRWQNYTGKQATLESTGQTYEELCNERA
jgi:16S rRNA G966 N2-methylase RsmD